MAMIAAEFGGTVPHSLSEYYRGGGLVPNVSQNAAIPTSGAIAMGNFYGSTNRSVINLTIATNTQNYNVFDNRGPTYIAGISDITVTVNAGVSVGSVSTGSFAMLVSSAFNVGDTVTIVNNGTIIGAGGAGGGGGDGFASPGYSGNNGGSALSISRPTRITNNSTVAGGGGGAGGGGAFSTFSGTRGGGGGGGGAGFNGGNGGAGSATTFPGGAGNPGTLTAGGSGGAGGAGLGGSGGIGGGQGAAGAVGGTSSQAAGGAGGSPGNYVVGNSFVTWLVTGTRLGGVS
jgi:hypothetical protein